MKGTPVKARQLVSPLGAVTLLSTLFIGSCVDGPVAGPTGENASHALQLAPQFGYAVAAGAPALTAGEVGALNDAFDLVNRFRLIVTRLGSGELLLDVILEVTPGQDVYDLAVDVPGIGPGESVSVVIVAMQGETTLFESPPLTVSTTDAQTATPPQPLSIPLTYIGPGAAAVSVEILSAGAVLPPGGTQTLEAVVTGSDGSPMSDVPLGWTVAGPSVASVNGSGTVTGGGGGRTQVTVTTPTGLNASVWVYVFGGEMTFVQGGMVMTAPVVGGTAQAIAGTGGAHGPVPTGSGVMYGEGGMIYISGVPIMNGSWPAPSPDGTKIAADGGGTILLANADGSGESEGPAGSQPAWAGGTSLFVSGGSIERVDVVSGSRSRVISGTATFPTVTDAGRLAYLGSGGQVFIQGAGPIAGVVTDSRPAIAGGWVLFAGAGGLMVAPVDGRSPVMPLGMSGTDPAWGSASGGFTPPAPPPAVQITGFDPATPIPGQEATILGSGFDPIIASNTRVFFPVDGGEVEVDILRITATTIRVLVPRSVRAGNVRVATLSSEATFPYTPMFGSVALTAATPWGAPVAGVGLSLSQAGAETASGVTGPDGSLFLDGILAGDYSAAYTAAAGFPITNTPPATVTVGTDVLNVEVQATPEVRRITVSPAVPTVEVGSSVTVSLEPLDINGNVIPQVDQVTWTGSSPSVRASGTTLVGTLTGVRPSVAPGDALFRVFVNGTGADFFATVTSYIEGTFTLPAAAAAPGEAAAAAEEIQVIEIDLAQGDQVVQKAETGPDGRYRFSGLLGGTYKVKPLPRATYKGYSPGSASVTLDGTNPTGRADFGVLRVKVDDGGPAPTGGILIYGPSLGSVSGLTQNEQTIAEFLGFVVTVADAATWSAMSTADFQQFNALVFGDPFCIGSTSYLATAAANTSTWGAAVTGPIALNTTDGILHQGSKPEGLTMTENGIAYAAGGSTTGLYATTGCSYFSSGGTVAFLAGIGTFVMRGQSGLADKATIVLPGHRLAQDLTNAGMSNWGNTPHGAFTSFPSGFVSVAEASTGDPMLIGRAEGAGAGAPARFIGGESGAFVVPGPLDSSQIFEAAPNLPPEEGPKEKGTRARPRIRQ